MYRKNPKYLDRAVEFLKTLNKLELKRIEDITKETTMKVGDLIKHKRNGNRYLIVSESLLDSNISH